MNSIDRAAEWLLQQPEKSIGENSINVLAAILDAHAEEAKAEQRKMCGFKAVDFFKKHGNSIYFDDLPDKLFDACLNATGETKDVR